MIPPQYETDTVWKVETNIDDLSPEVTGNVLGKLFDAGALDAWLTPIQMKKNRPGVLVSALCELPALDRITALLFTETTTFGLRIEQIFRLKLSRRFESVQTEAGDITLKVGIAGGKILKAVPEYESCRAGTRRLISYVY